MVMLVCMALFGVVNCVIYGNGGGAMLGMQFGFWLVVAWIAGLFLWAKWQDRDQNQEAEKSEKMKFPGWCLVISFLTWPLFVVISVSSFVFDSESINGDEKIWIIDDSVKQEGRLHFAVPFLQDIRSIATEQNVGMLVVATTKDNIKIQGYVYAELRLASDEATILRSVKALVHPDRQIERELEVLLTYSFREAIAQHDLADLQNNLVLEWQTGNRVLGQPLTAFGVKWEGTLAVSYLHAYFGEKNQKSVL